MLLQRVPGDIAGALGGEVSDAGMAELPRSIKRVRLVADLARVALGNGPILRSGVTEGQEVSVWPSRALAKLATAEGADTNRRQATGYAVRNDGLANAIQAAIKAVEPFGLTGGVMVVIDGKSKKLVFCMQLGLMLATKRILGRMV